VLLSQTTMHHIDDLSDLNQQCLLAADEEDNDDHNVGDAAAKMLDQSTGGLLPITQLCGKAVQLYNDVAAMEIILENKDRALEQMDAEIARLIADENDATSTSTSTSASTSTSVVKPTMATSFACTQTDTMSPHPVCRDCDSLRQGMARIADIVSKFGLINNKEISGNPGVSPFSCNQLSIKYLQSHAKSLEKVLQLRDVAIEERKKAQGISTQTQAMADRLGRQLSQAKRDHQQQIEALEAQIEESITAATEAKVTAHRNLEDVHRQHKQELVQISSQHSLAFAKMETDFDELQQRSMAQHVAEISSLREVGTANTVHITKLTKQLVDASTTSASSSGSLRDATVTIQRLEQELSDTQKQLQSMTTKADNAVQQTVDLNHQLGIQNEESKSTSNLLTNVTNDFNDLKLKFANVESQSSIDQMKAHEALKSVQDELRISEQTQQKTESDLKRAETWLDRTGQERTKMIQHISDLESKLTNSTTPQYQHRHDQISSDSSTSNRANCNYQPSRVESEPVMNVHVRYNEPPPTSQHQHESHESHSYHNHRHTDDNYSPATSHSQQPQPQPSQTPYATAPTPPMERKQAATSKDFTRASSVTPIPPSSASSSKRNNRQAAIKKYLAARNANSAS